MSLEKIFSVIFFCLTPLNYVLVDLPLGNTPMISYLINILLSLIVITLFFKIILTQSIALNIVEYLSILISILMLFIVITTGNFISHFYMIKTYIIPMGLYFMMRRVECSEKLLNIILSLIVTSATIISIISIIQVLMLINSLLEPINISITELSYIFKFLLSSVQSISVTHFFNHSYSMYLILVLIISVLLRKTIVLNNYLLKACQFIIFVAIIISFSLIGWVTLAILSIIYLLRNAFNKNIYFKSEDKLKNKKPIFSLIPLVIVLTIVSFFVPSNFAMTAREAFIYPIWFMLSILWLVSFIFIIIEAKRLQIKMNLTIQYFVLTLFIFYLSLPIIEDIVVMSFLFGFIGLISSRVFTKKDSHISVYSKHDISSAYSTLVYLKQMLNDEKIDVTIWSWTEKRNRELLKKVDPEGMSFLFCWYSYIPKFRFIIAILHSYYITYIHNSVVIVNDIDFFPAYYIYKRLFRSTKVIHFCTEIYGEDIQTKKYNIDFYQKHADYPDMIIECLDKRAEYRKDKYNIKKKIYVINNTLPLDIKASNKKTTFFDYFSDFDSHGLPIVIYAGGAYLNRDLDKFIQGLQKAKSPVCFVAFCYGSKEDLYRLQEYCEMYFKKTYYIHNAISRKELVNVMTNADIGIVYYDPNKSINYRYASPTKFYEYMSNGLNILCSNNEGINHIILKNGIGTCIMEDTIQGIADAYDSMINHGLKDKEEIKNIFKEKYCYEIDSFDTVQAIKELLKGAH